MNKVLVAGQIDLITNLYTSNYPKENHKVKCKSQSTTLQGSSINILLTLTGFPNLKSYYYCKVGKDFNSNSLKYQLNEDKISTDYLYKSDNVVLPVSST